MGSEMCIRDSYLLLSGYERVQSLLVDTMTAANPDLGVKTLLGISDPNSEFLDTEGNFIGQPGAVIAGVGDMSDFVTDAGRIVNQDLANNENADQIGDNSGQLGEALRQGGAGVESGLGELQNQMSDPSLGQVAQASDLAVWELENSEDGLFTLRSAVTGQYLVVGDDGAVALASEADQGHEFELAFADSCQAYPEAQLNAERVSPTQGPRIYWDETERKNVYGWVDDHAHITAYEFIGGRINYGATHHKFGVDHALGNLSLIHI